MKKFFKACHIACWAIVIIFSLLDGSDALDNGLFAPVDVSSDMEKPRDATVVRSRLVSVDLNRMADQPNGSGVANSITLNLFPDVVLNASLDRVDHNPSGSYTWVGHVDGESSSFVTLVVFDGQITGNVFLPTGKFYNVRPLDGGVHVTAELDRSKFPPNTGIHPPHQPADPDAPRAPEKSADPSSMQDGGSIIDILILYTTQARISAGGASQMTGLIDLAVSISNTAFSVSGINTRLRLVHTEEVNFNESTLNSGQILDALTNATGSFVNVPTLRNIYGADLVALFTSQLPDACGIAWQGSEPYDATRGFSVNLANCSGDNYTLPHEVGHNMGGGHARSEGTPPGSEGGAYAYSYAYIDPAGTFRTMMATGAGTLIPQFSNPSVNYNGTPTGVAAGSPTAANNALSINTSAPSIARFRDSASASSYAGTYTTTGVAINLARSGTTLSGTFSTGTAGGNMGGFVDSNGRPYTWAWWDNSSLGSGVLAGNLTVAASNQATFNFGGGQSSGGRIGQTVVSGMTQTTLSGSTTTTAATGTANYAGTYSGSGVTITLTQSGSTLSGTFSTGALSGTVGGFVDSANNAFVWAWYDTSTGSGALGGKLVVSGNQGTFSFGGGQSSAGAFGEVALTMQKQ